MLFIRWFFRFVFFFFFFTQMMSLLLIQHQKINFDRH